MPSVGSAANGEPGTPDQNVPVPASAAWRPRRGGGSEGDFPPSVHWDSDVEANHTPGGSRRQREEPSLPRRMWDSLPAVAASAAASPTPGRNGAVEGREVKALGLQWDWRQTFEGWELAAAFAAALMLVNGIALSHAAGPGITFFRGPSWAKPHSELPDWNAQHHAYVDSLFRARKSGEGFEILFYGDSILETFRGTSRGGPCARCAGGPEVYAKHFGSKYRSEVLAISGDTTSNLMWRLDHGESPADAGVRVLVLLIGANDLGIAAREVRRLIRQMLPWSVRFQDEAKVIGTVGHVTGPETLAAAVPRAASRTVSIAQRLLEDAPDAHVLLMPVLPGGDYVQPLPQRLAYPNRYSIATQQVNGIVKAELGHQRRVRFPDCSYDSVLLTPNRTSIQPELMPDGLHPSADAWDALATACLDAGLAQLLSSE